MGMGWKGKRIFFLREKNKDSLSSPYKKQGGGRNEN